MALPTLLTDRLRLRPWTEEDGLAFHEISGDPRVIWWGHTESPAASSQKLEEILARVRAMPEGLGWWAVEARDGGRVVGNAVLQPATYDDTAELGYHLVHEAWGRVALRFFDFGAARHIRGGACGQPRLSPGGYPLGAAPQGPDHL